MEPRWSEELYTVRQVNRRDGAAGNAAYTYKLSKSTGAQMEGTYQREEVAARAQPGDGVPGGPTAARQPRAPRGAEAEELCIDPASAATVTRVLAYSARTFPYRLFVYLERFSLCDSC